MHRHCLRSSICRHSKPVKASFRSHQGSFVNLFAGPNPSRTCVDQMFRPLHQSVAQQTQASKSELLYNSILNDPALAPTGNLSQATEVENENEGEDLMFPPGTFIEIRKNERAVPAVVIGEKIENQRHSIVSISSSGRMFVSFTSDVHFSIPNIVSASVAERCILPDTLSLVTPEIQAARVEVLKRLQTLVSQVDNQAAGMEQGPLNVYLEVMDPDPTKWTTTTVAHVTSLLYERPTFIEYYIVHKYLMDRPLLYLADPSYLLTQRFHVRPSRDVEEIEEVTGYIHKWRNGQKSVFPNFVHKAQTVVERHKGRRESGPITQEIIDVTWGDKDRTILNFFLRSLQPHRSNQSDPYQTGRTELVKAILQPTITVNENLTFELAVKLGLVAPWQDLNELDPMINPWGDFTFTKSIESEGDRLLRSSLASKAKAGSVVGPMDFLPSDPLESIRHDFGDAEVFVIDDPTAEELDDGISLERIPSEPENHWVHVHIADPTSVIHPNHVLAKMARRQGQTYYLSQKSIPLFPIALVNHPDYSLSLGGNPGVPSRVMTFSIKLGGNGDILDYTVRAGLIRNVKRMTYSEVNTVLDEPPPVIRYPLGGVAPTLPKATFNDSVVKDLQTLMDLANDQVSKRVREGVWQYAIPKSQLRWNSRIPSGIRTPSLNSSLYHGFPDLTYEVDEDSMFKGSHCLVGEMMKLANRVVSRIFLDHNVPAIRVSMNEAVTKSPQDLEVILNARNSWGSVPQQTVIKHVELERRGQLTLEPKGHFVLGIPDGEGYVRATSPLRRYEDMIAHWQLHSILLKSNTPVFSASDLEKMITEYMPSSKFSRTIGLRSSDNLGLLYIKQYAAETAKGVERPFGDPLSSMDAYVLSSSLSTISRKSFVKIFIPLLGVQAAVVDGAVPLGDLPRGADLRVKFDTIELGAQKARMNVSVID